MDVALVDHHCHGVARSTLTRAELEAFMTESDRPPPNGCSAFDSLLRIAVRRWRGPALDLDAGAEPEGYVRRRAEPPGNDQRTLRFDRAVRAYGCRPQERPGRRILGTRAYYALSIRASDPDGQIVSWAYRQLVESGTSVGAVGDGGCGLGGRRNGHVYDSALPIKKLRAGIYRFRITVEASTCTRDAKSDSASRTFTIHVR